MVNPNFSNLAHYFQAYGVMDFPAAVHLSVYHRLCGNCAAVFVQGS